MAVESELHAENAHTADRSPLTGRTQISRTAEQVDGASEGIQRKHKLIKPDDRVLPNCRADLDGEEPGKYPEYIEGCRCPSVGKLYQKEFSWDILKSMLLTQSTRYLHEGQLFFTSSEHLCVLPLCIITIPIDLDKFRVARAFQTCTVLRHVTTTTIIWASVSAQKEVRVTEMRLVATCNRNRRSTDIF